MAIKDYDGTTKYEIGKIYDYDGTTKYQIGKVYDNDGTTSNLIYSAEYVISDTTSTTLGTATTSGGDGMMSYWFDGNGLNCGAWDVYVRWIDHWFTFPNAINTSGYTTMYVNYLYETNSYGDACFRLYLNDNTVVNTGWATFTTTQTGTWAIDVSSLGSVSFKVNVSTHCTGGDFGATIRISKIWLE